CSSDLSEILHSRCSAAFQIFVKPRFFQVGYHDSPLRRYMHKHIIMQINAYMVNFLFSKSEKNQVPFLQLMVILTLHNLCHLARGARQFHIVHPLEKIIDKSRASYSALVLSAQAMWRTYPFVNISI